VVQLAGRHPDRQRQAAAQPGDLPDPGVGGAEPRPDGQPDQQPGRLAGRQGVQADRLGVFQRGQPPPGTASRGNGAAEDDGELDGVGIQRYRSTILGGCSSVVVRRTSPADNQRILA
jgi:hypothetical protein